MNALMLFSTMLLFFLVEYSIISFFPVYLSEYLGFTRSQIGYFVGVFSISAFAVKFCSGYLIDRFGRLKIFLPAMSLCVVSTCLFAVVTTFWSIFAVRLLHGFGSGVVRAVYPTLSVDISGQQRAGWLLGIIGMTATIAMFIASPLSYFIDHHFSHLHLFSVLVVIGVLAVASIPFIGIKRIKHPQRPPFKLSSFLEFTILDLAFLRFIGSTWHGLFLAFGLIYARERGVVNAGVLLIAYAAGNCLMRPVTGYVIDKFGPRLIGSFCYSLYLCGYLAFSGAQAPLSLCLSIFVVGLAVGIETILLQSMAAKSVAEQAISRSNSTIECFYSLGIVFGTIVLGHYLSSFSFSQLFYLIGLFNLFPFMVFHLLVLPGYSRRLA